MKYTINFRLKTPDRLDVECQESVETDKKYHVAFAEILDKLPKNIEVTKMFDASGKEY